jgi:Concanavalin A-like lectin/glucanases superfamily
MKFTHFLSVLVIGGAVLGANVVFSQPVPSPDAWWQAESNANDSAGTNNGVVSSNFSFVPGHSGQAFSLAGGTITVADAANLDSPTNLTVQFWVKGTQPNPFQYILTKNGAPAGASYAFYTGNSDGLYFWVDVPGDTGNSGLVISPGAATAAIWDDNWHQVTGVYDGIAVHLYVDGAEIGSGTPTTTTAPSNGISYSPAGQLVFGNFSVGGGSAWSGTLDDVKVFSRAFTSDDAVDTFTNADSTANTNALSSWWKADGNALDSWGVNSGTINASTVSYFRGKTGEAFLSAGGAIIVSNSPVLEPQNITVQAWVKSLSPGNFKYVLSKCRVPTWSSYALYTAGNGGITFFVSVGPSGNGTLTLSPSADPGIVWDGAWHQVTGTYDGAAVHLYVDGLEVGSGTPAPGTIDYASSPSVHNGALVIANDPTLAFNMAGGIDDVKIWDSALTAQQVAQSYAASGLVSWWRAEGNANDSIGTNNGTLTGSVTYGISRLVGTSFNTAGGAVVVPESSTLEPSAITVEALVSGVPPGTNKYIISKSFSSANASYALYTGTNGGISFYVTVNGTVMTSPAVSPSAIWDGAFHFVDGTYDGSSVRLFIDGIEVGSGTPASGAIQYGAAFDSGELLFGDFSDSLSTSNFVGSLDEIKIYSSALSALNIAANAFQPAIIVSQPQNVTANSGGSATFSVSALPAGASYQWSFNGTNLAGQTRSALALTNVSQAAAGNYRVAVSVGAQYVSNSVLGGLAFRLPNADIDVTQNASLEPDGAVNGMTVQAWVRNSGSPGQFKAIITKTFSGGVGSFSLYTGGSGGIFFYVWLHGQPADSLVLSPDGGTGIWDGNWHQVTGIYDGEFVRLYVDGQQVGSGSDSLTGGSIEYSNGRTANGDLVIGAFSSPPVSLYGGDIDEVKLFDHSLTDSDVSDTFANQNSVASTNGLISWWKGEGNAFDSVSTNNGRIVPPGGTILSDIATLSVTLAAAQFQNAHFGGGNFQATLTGPTGQNYLVQRSSSLSNPTWVNVTTNSLPFTFSEPLNSSNAFYRAVSQP